MAWWTQSGLTTTIAHDAMNGGGDRLINRMAAVNPALIDALPITGEKYWCVVGHETAKLEYQNAVTRPSSGACVALVNPMGRMVLNTSGVYASPWLLSSDLDGTWRMPDENRIPAPVGLGVWQCVGVQWTASQFRIYLNNAWADIARPHAGLLPSTLKGVVHGGDWGFNARLAAMGVWSGSVTLALLQNIEAMMRAELAVPGIAARGYPPGLVGSSLGPQGMQPGPPGTKALRMLRGWRNIEQSGVGVIEGITTIEDIPGSRQVRLYDKHTGMLVAETWSSPTGAYRFDNLDAQREYFVVAHDYKREYNAVVSDMLTP